MPDAVLDEIAVEPRERMWRQTLTAVESPLRVWIAEQSGEIVGFAATGPARGEDAEPGTAEVYAIYLERVVQGTGVGRALFTRAVDDLRDRGYGAAILWVLESNAATRRF